MDSEICVLSFLQISVQIAQSLKKEKKKQASMCAFLIDSLESPSTPPPQILTAL